MALIRLFIICLFATLPLWGVENMLRTWTSFGGSTIDARLSGDPDAAEVTLQLADGSKLMVEVRLLSAGDQDYLSARALVANRPNRILFIGNSYTSGIRGTFSQMVAVSPFADCELAFISPGGKTLAFHLDSEVTMQRIREGEWDFVVLQDQSQTPAVSPDNFHDAAKKIDRIIDKAGAQTVFYETWGRRDGDKRFIERFPDFEKMQKALSDAYSKTAKSCDAQLAPVGQAWALVRELDPELGRQLYANDGSHPGPLGRFLAASVFYTLLFQADPAELDFNGGFHPKQVRLIQQAVAKVMQESSRN
jgi:hypothetical protein